MRAEQFNRILAQVKGQDVEKLVNEVVLRSQSQAEYAAENYGHFGLNLRRYAHFTSPIRRYADLIVHRALIRARNFGADGLPESQDAAALTEIAAQISAAERRAMKAERETNDRLIAHHLADRIGASFEGRISGVTRAGLFVKLDDTGADGFIPARTIGDEYFRYEEAMHAMVGNRSRRDPPARRPRHGQAGRGGAGRRRAALRASVRRPRHDRRAAPAVRPSRRQGRTRAPPREEAVPGQKAVSWKAPMTDVPPELMQKFSTDAMGGHPNIAPKDASTLILLDRSGAAPKVLMGKRHDRHVFMPGNMCFPAAASIRSTGRCRSQHRSIRAPSRS